MLFNDKSWQLFSIFALMMLETSYLKYKKNFENCNLQAQETKELPARRQQSRPKPKYPRLCPGIQLNRLPSNFIDI
jgi:hypothetical protein